MARRWPPAGMGPTPLRWYRRAWERSIKAFIQTVHAWRDALLVMAQAWYGLKIAGWIADLRGLYGQFIALPAATATAAGA